jgi:hypothetical protein
MCLRRLAAHTGLEPVISALRGQRVNQLHQCAVALDYRGRAYPSQVHYILAKSDVSPVTFSRFPRMLYSAFAIPLQPIR